MDPKANRPHIAQKLSQTLSEIDFRRLITSYIRLFKINWPGEHSRRDWTPAKEDLLNNVESGHTGLAPKSLGKISTKGFKHDLDSDRTLKACVSHTERRRKKKVAMASTVDADESTDKENLRPRTSKKLEPELSQKLLSTKVHAYILH